jgi:predicted ABC-type ATPase
MAKPRLFVIGGCNRFNLFFFCLDAIEKAKEKVRIRVENGGHFVPEDEIEKRYKMGFENLDLYFPQFDFVHLFNSSFYKTAPRHISSIKNGRLIYLSEFPEFLKFLTPSIAKICLEERH